MARELRYRLEIEKAKSWSKKMCRNWNRQPRTYGKYSLRKLENEFRRVARWLVFTANRVCNLRYTFAARNPRACSLPTWLRVESRR